MQQNYNTTRKNNEEITIEKSRDFKNVLMKRPL